MRLVNLDGEIETRAKVGSDGNDDCVRLVNLDGEIETVHGVPQVLAALSREASESRWRD